jgi:hypothetical protein
MPIAHLDRVTFSLRLPAWSGGGLTETEVADEDVLGPAPLRRRRSGGHSGQRGFVGESDKPVEVGQVGGQVDVVWDEAR